MAIPFQDAIISNLGQPKPANPIIGRGSLITFNYIFHKNDPIPLVLVTDIWPKYIRGVNLHYLTFPTIKKLLYPGSSMCENSSVTYQYIKGNDYVSSAFRQYKREGVISLKKMNCDLIVKAMAMVRSFDPNEIEAIRKEIREQLNRITNPQAF